MSPGPVAPWTHDMIRVGFIMAVSDKGWLGGTSYYRNLFSAIKDLPERKIDPVLIASGSSFDLLKDQFPGMSIVHLPLLDAPALVGQARRVMRVVSGRDLLMEHALRSKGIGILSHSGHVGKRSPIYSISWIPDFQELAFPEFFSPRELAARRRNVVTTCRRASTLLLSSESALSDLRKIGMGDVATAVLPFVAGVPSPGELLPRDTLEAEYGVGDKYFHLPNQFWIHKNHAIVLEALAVLRRRGKPVRVIATGNTVDPRQPDHFKSLMETARTLGVDDLFKPLGVVPYIDMMSLMRHAVAVINPSKFEGWSTTVEEAKSMGKAILLSDIPVHREQAPDRAGFFGTDDASGLAELMLQSLNQWDAGADTSQVARAATALSARRQAFARRYEDIVLEAVTRHGSETRTSMHPHQTSLDERY